MVDRNAPARGRPTHGEIVEVVVPAEKRRRRWCDLCGIWTWELGYGSGMFYHGKNRRTRECKERDA